MDDDIVGDILGGEIVDDEDYNTTESPQTKSARREGQTHARASGAGSSRAPSDPFAHDSSSMAPELMGGGQYGSQKSSVPPPLDSYDAYRARSSNPAPSHTSVGYSNPYPSSYGGYGDRNSSRGRAPSSSRGSGPPSRHSPRPSGPGDESTIRVSRVPPEHLNLSALSSHFAAYGTVEKIEMKPESSQAFLQFHSRPEAVAALRGTSSNPVFGNPSIQVSFAKFAPRSMESAGTKRPRDYPNPASSTPPYQQQQQQQQQQPQQSSYGRPPPVAQPAPNLMDGVARAMGIADPDASPSIGKKSAASGLTVATRLSRQVQQQREHFEKHEKSVAALRTRLGELREEWRRVQEDTTLENVIKGRMLRQLQREAPELLRQMRALVMGLRATAVATEAVAQAEKQKKKTAPVSGQKPVMKDGVPTFTVAGLEEEEEEEEDFEEEEGGHFEGGEEEEDFEGEEEEEEDVEGEEEVEKEEEEFAEKETPKKQETPPEKQESPPKTQETVGSLSGYFVSKGDVLVCEVHFDGAAKGNPGRSGAGAVVSRGGRAIAEISKFVSDSGTNNGAEYSALLSGLKLVRLAAERGHFSNVACAERTAVVRVLGDSQLVLRQMTGEYRVKSDTLKPLNEEARRMAAEASSAVKRATGAVATRLEYVEIPREENEDADRLANVGVNAHAEDPDSITWRTAPPSQSTSTSSAAGPPATIAILKSSMPADGTLAKLQQHFAAFGPVAQASEDANNFLIRFESHTSAKDAITMGRAFGGCILSATLQ